MFSFSFDSYERYVHMTFTSFLLGGAGSQACCVLDHFSTEFILNCGIFLEFMF